jgi:hypothetical protein
MSKKIIRLTESNLKNYIKKIVAEQVANTPAPAPASKPGVAPTTPSKPPSVGQAIDAAVKGKNVQMYRDAQKQTKAGLYRIQKTDSIATDGKIIWLEVLDLDTININTGDANHVEDPKKIINIIQWKCGDSVFYCSSSEGYMGVKLYNPELAAALSTAMNCNQFKVNPKPDFASNGGVRPSNQA